jgi:hypothetical protein
VDSLLRELLAAAAAAAAALPVGCSSLAAAS